MSNKIRVGIATYGEVIDSLKDTEKWLIDVRDVQEIAETGQIPTSINIPRKFFNIKQFSVSLPFSIDFIWKS